MGSIPAQGRSCNYRDGEYFPAVPLCKRIFVQQKKLVPEMKLPESEKSLYKCLKLLFLRCIFTILRTEKRRRAARTVYSSHFVRIAYVF